MNPETQVLAILRDQVADIVAGTIFLSIGFAACSLAAIRRRRAVRVFVWLGLWSGMYGARLLLLSPAVAAILPYWLRAISPYAIVSIGYLLVAVGTLVFLELSLGNLRRLIKIVLWAAIAVALGGIGWFVFGGSESKFVLYNNFVTVCGLLILIPVVTIKKLSEKFLVFPNRRVLTTGTLVFAVAALYVNLSRVLHLPTARMVDTLGFFILLFSFGYLAVQVALAGEKRLLSIENELAIARRLQFSILPASTPEVRNVRIAASYQPMTAVAGDFYEFLPVDQHRAGFLIADVSGHGVPAALIASMVKVATKTAADWAKDPSEVLRRLGNILCGQMQGQFVSAAYLWIDTETRTARYSAAGHPPLLCWRGTDNSLTRVESNGLLFGVLPDADYPTCDISFSPGDRFVLYTDGVIEPENAGGEAFGDHKLEQILRENQSRPPAELSDRLVAAVRAWQPPSVTQQDDITLIVIDVL